MEKKNTSVSEVEFLDMIDDEDEGFMESDEISGKVLNSFNFNGSDAALASRVDFSSNTPKKLLQFIALKNKNLQGLTK